MKQIMLILVGLALVAGSAFAIGDFGVTLDTSTFLSSGVIDTTAESQYRAAVMGRAVPVHWTREGRWTSSPREAIATPRSVPTYSTSTSCGSPGCFRRPLARGPLSS